MNLILSYLKRAYSSDFFNFLKINYIEHYGHHINYVNFQRNLPSRNASKAQIISSHWMFLFTFWHVCLRFGVIVGPFYSVWTHFLMCYGISVGSIPMKILSLHVTMVSFHITNFQKIEKSIEYALLRTVWEVGNPVQSE